MTQAQRDSAADGASPWARIWTVAGVPALVAAALILWGTMGAAWGAPLLLAAAAGSAWQCRTMCRRLAHEREESRELSDQLVQSQKLAALGELSAGIAHEINNPLAIISQEAEIMGLIMANEAYNTVPDAAELKDGLREILAQVVRCGQITHKMLDFARKRTPVIQQVDLHALIEDMVLLVGKEVTRRGVTIERRFDERVPELNTDPPLVRQVVLNLLNNAAQALGKGGTITIETGRIKDSAFVTVRDNGPGIAPEHLEKIFNPFFTTKGPGQGTGLGLSICQRLMHELGGNIKVQSRQGQGAAFTITLPIKGRPESSPWPAAA